jgi:DNA polymerase I
LKYAKNIVNDLREKKTPKEKVIIHTQIQKELNEYSSITPHVAIARLLRSRGQHIAPGTRIEFIVTPGKGVIRDRVKLPDEAEDYDSDYYINNQVIPAVERIFNVLGYKEEDLVGQKKQSTLGKFF